MALVSLDLAALHLRADGDAEAELITLYLGGAEQSAIDYLNRRVFEDQSALDAAIAAGEAGDFPMVVNDAIRVAILKTLGELYANREESVVGVTVQSLPLDARALLRPHRIIPGL